MPKPKIALNAFPPVKASRIVGMSVHMLNYLAREGYLVPTYGRTGTRGKTRRYSYRDLVVARIVQTLLDAGVEVSRLKTAIQELRHRGSWMAGGNERILRHLVTEGSRLYYPEENGSLSDLTQQGQFAFAFVLDVNAAKAEVKQRMSEEERAKFSLENRRIKFAPKKARRSRGTTKRRNQA